MRAQRSNPVNYARAYARLYYDWIATVAMLPRDTLIEHNKKLSTVPSSPLWRGAAQRRGGQSDQENATPLSLRAITDGVAIQ